MKLLFFILFAAKLKIPGVASDELEKRARALEKVKIKPKKTTNSL